MPIVQGVKYPYTKRGEKKAAKKAKKQSMFMPDRTNVKNKSITMNIDLSKIK